ncbi:YVTN family beta-propeller protein [Mucilaginibacter gracilis]|uniref:YVTN family beta-propeller protein n=1 Tax=Mucilaginibacter gracilis TaxID=423350 RepID=A0A495J9M9_9SPHI|nr:YncE family protein [Mucilaginibacter gracilis]RKR85401.1 YVTN family beta-propeller protein [Mucilaginibacter gracilis]
MTKLFSIFSATLLVVSTSVALRAQDKQYVLDKKIALPGDGGYDYLSIDKVNNRLYISHGTAVNVVDLATEKVIGSIDGMQGVHGIAIDNKANKGFISDGRGNAAVAFNLKTLQKVATIPLTNKGADAIMYDAFSDKVYVFNGDANNASVVNPNTLKQIGTIALGGAPEFAVSNEKGLIYNNLEDKNSLNVIDTKTQKVIKNYPLTPCGGPTGLALDDKNQRLFTVCRENKGMSVVDATSGRVITTIPIGAGVDAVAYDAETKLVIVSNGDGTTTIIKQQSANEYKTVQTLTTQVRAKTLALDTKTHKIYLSAAEFEKGTRKVVPGTFTLLVYKLQ